MLVAPSHSTSEFVWTEFYNNTHINSVTYVCMIGLLMSLFSFSGYEAGAHMAEETVNASSSAPKGILFTCLCTTITGFIYIIGILYAINGNIAGINHGQTNEAIINAFQIAFTDNGIINTKGIQAMTSLLIINIFFAGFSNVTVTSRIGFAMARDGAIPFSKVFKEVNTRTKTPIRMIFLVFFLDSILCLLPLISKTAFAAITSITTIGYQISYAIPILLRVTLAKD